MGGGKPIVRRTRMSGAAEAILWVVFGLSMAVLWAFFAGQFFLIVCHLRLRRRAMRREAALLAEPLPEDAGLPHVVVQLPVYNEGPLVRRAIAAAVALEWPRNKLHIQVLDDSTDDSDAAAAAAVGEFRAGGADIELIHRENRQEFKAGALREAMETVDHPYFVIFDADYVPPPDFLARCMRPMLADPAVGFVQGRVDFLNADANWLTRGQSMMLDSHLAIEQATRSWLGFFFPFNGTCGVWRRQAVDDAGGWEGGTLAEDMDLSYRVWRAGWRGHYLVSVAAPGELPATVASWVQQQRRWVRGSGQAARRFAGALFRRGEPGEPVEGRGAHPVRRWSPSAIWHSSAWWCVPATAAFFTLAAVACLAVPGSIPLVGWLVGATILGAVATASAMQIAAATTLRPEKRPGRILRDHLCFWRIGVAFPLVGVRTLVESALDIGSSFERTPKRGT